MTLAEKIKKAQEELTRQRDALNDAITASDEAPEDEALTAQVEELSMQVEAATKHLNALERAEKALANRAAPTGDNTPPMPTGAPAYVHNLKSNIKKPGDLIVRMALVKAVAHVLKKSDEEVLAERYKGHEDLRAVFDYTKRTAIDPATTTASGWAAELVQSDTRGFLESLEPNSVAAALANRSLQLNFGGYQSITVPRMDAIGATPTEPAWVGEGGAIPLTQFNFGATTINRYKLAAITTLTMELVERSTPQAEALLRDGLSKAYAKVLDNAFLSAAAAVAGVRPAGILNNVTVNSGDATGGMDSVIADMKTLVGALVSTNMGVRPVLLLNSLDRLGLGMLTSPLGEMTFRDELDSGRLMGIEVVSSTNVPQGTAIIIDASVLATAFDTPRFDISQVATVVEANADATPPTMADDGSGAVGAGGQVPAGAGIPVVPGAAGAAAAGYEARSLWQTYSEGIRMIAPTSWTMMRPNAVHALNTLAW